LRNDEWGCRARGIPERADGRAAADGVIVEMIVDKGRAPSEAGAM